MIILYCCIGVFVLLYILFKYLIHKFSKPLEEIVVSSKFVGQEVSFGKNSFTIRGIERTRAKIAYYTKEHRIAIKRNLEILDNAGKQELYDDHAIELCNEVQELILADKMEEAKDKMFALKDFVKNIKIPELFCPLDDEFCSLPELIREVGDVILLISGCSELSFKVLNIMDRKVRLDMHTMRAVLREYSKAFYDIRLDTNPGEEIYLLLTFSYVNIDYFQNKEDLDLNSKEKIVLSEPALRIVLSENVFKEIREGILKDTYKRTIEYMVRKPRKGDDNVNANLEYALQGIEEHFGIAEVFEEDMVWVCVIPIDFHKIRKLNCK